MLDIGLRQRKGFPVRRVDPIKQVNSLAEGMGRERAANTVERQRVREQHRLCTPFLLRLGLEHQAERRGRR